MALHASVRAMHAGTRVCTHVRTHAHSLAHTRVDKHVRKRMHGHARKHMQERMQRRTVAIKKADDALDVLQGGARGAGSSSRPRQTKHNPPTNGHDAR